MAGRSRRANGDGSVFKDKYGIWHSRIKIGFLSNGQPKYKEFKSKDQKSVVRKKKEYEAQHEIDAKSCVDSRRLDTYIREWLENVKKNEIKSSSYARAVSTVETYIIPYLGHYKLCSLDANIIQTELINRLRDEKNAVTHKPNSFSTINKAYVYLHACLRYAVSNRILKYDPCTTVTLPTARKLDAKEKRFFTDEEIAAFLQTCDLGEGIGKKGYSKYGWLYKVILYTGIRAGEALALKKESVSLSEKRITICRTVVDARIRDASGNVHARSVCQETTKNGRTRYVPLAQAAIDCLTPVLAVCGEDDYLASQSARLANIRYFSYEYAQICKKAGIQNPQGVHTLRHTFASKLFRSGVDVKTVSEILGHASVAFTYKTYIHLIERTKDDAVSVWDEEAE